VDTINFLELIFGSSTGYIIIASKDDNGNLTNNKAFKYPEQQKAIGVYCGMRTEVDLWFSPMLYSVPMRKARNAMVTPVVYADTDSFDPEGFLIKPSISIITSSDPLKRHSYWVLDQTTYSPQSVEAAARAIALTHASKDSEGNQTGTDSSGWDLSQLLRLPNSVNTKHTPAQQVTIEEVTGEVYSLEDITNAYSSENVPERITVVTDDLPDNLPSPTDVLRKVTGDPRLAKMYSHQPSAGQDMSDLLYSFISELFRSGFTPEEAVVAAWNVPYNKYKRDNRPMQHMWQYDITKASADPANKPRSTIDSVIEPMLIDRPKSKGIAKEIEAILLTDKERGMLTTTFVDEYLDWACERTDAPEAYHIAGALTIMSLTLGEWGYVEPDFGKTTLGLFFMVMGETTKTRKTTARNMMKSILRSLDKFKHNSEHKYILTSDVTPETLLDVLAERPDVSSLYDRDEGQQLIADVKGGRGYMKGFFETLNELYDGHAHGRMRQGHKTEETPVVFVQYLMGIRSQIQEEMEAHDYKSGYGARNIYVIGEATEERARRPQQGGKKTDVKGGLLSERIGGSIMHWSGKQTHQSNKANITFTDEAWGRLWGTDEVKGFSEQLTEYVEGHHRGDILAASVDRLGINVMKVACLFAMDRKSAEVELSDLLNAIHYSVQWVEDLIIMVEGVTESMLQRDLNKIVEFISDRDGGIVTRIDLIKWGNREGLDKWKLEPLIENLVETEMIQAINDGAGKPCYVTN
jgi:hypothetical protein